MGWTFDMTLMPKAESAEKTRETLLAALRQMGCELAGDAQAGMALRVHCTDRGKYAGLSGELLSVFGGEEAEKRLKALSKALGRPLIHLLNLDSDWFCATVYAGGKSVSLRSGFDPETGRRCMPRKLPSAFGGIVPDEKTGEALLESFRAEHVFSEEEAQALSEAVDFDPALLDPEAMEAAETLFFTIPEAKGERFLPASMPPALKMSSWSYGNPYCCSVQPAGGEGRGVRIWILPERFPSRDWHCPVVTVQILRDGGGDRAIWRVRPEAVTLQDGSWGWRADLPEVPIGRGLDPEHPWSRSAAAFRSMGESELNVGFVLTGDGSGFKQSLRFDGLPTFEEDEPFVSVCIHPLEDPRGAAEAALPACACSAHMALQMEWLWGEYAEDVRALLRSAGRLNEA